MRPRIGNFAVVAGTVLLAAFAGCLYSGRSHTQRSSSVVAYLYPNQANPLPPTSIPVLRLPLRVGIAFVPSDQGRSALSELQKNALLQRVADQ